MSSSDDDNKLVCPEMGYYCFDVLLDYLNGTKNAKKPTFTDDPYPLFVTWTTGKQRQLRGCIGTFDRNLNLHKGLKDYAVQSAIHDSRFPSVSLNEFEKLNVSVSLLTNFELAQNYLDWIVGKHGIQIDYTSPDKRKRSATYLPEVALEHNMTKEVAINQLIRKSGYQGDIDKDLINSLNVTRYQSEKITVTYEQYKAARSS